MSRARQNEGLDIIHVVILVNDVDHITFAYMTYVFMKSNCLPICAHLRPYLIQTVCTYTH